MNGGKSTRTCLSPTTYLGVVPREFSTLHSHFMELYSTFKQGVRYLPLIPNSYPTSFADENYELLTFYVKTRFQLLVSDIKFQTPEVST
jgi:hypothetical protein